MIFTTTYCLLYFFFSSRRRHTRSTRDWSSDVCSSDLETTAFAIAMASGILTRVPPPTRKGTTTTSACERYGRTSGTHPMISTEGHLAAIASNRGEGFRPTTTKLALDTDC